MTASSRHSRLRRRQTPTVAVLLMDLDHFKYVNDTLGHEIGDLLLREVAARLRDAVSVRDAPSARLGGDEFAILLPGEGRRARDASPPRCCARSKRR